MKPSKTGEPSKTAENSNEKKKKGWRTNVAAATKLLHRRSKEQETTAASPHEAPTTDDSSSLILKEASLRTFSLDTPAKRWLSSFGRSDPRWQIMRFFNQVEGARTMDELSSTQQSPLFYFSQASVFTVWRPTSAVAIRRMIAGEATGKGLEIKGKSSKAGKLSGYVPFLQIYDEEHKQKVRTLARGGRTRIFFASSEARDVVVAELEPLQNEILNVVQDAKRIVKHTAMTSLAPLNPIGRTISRAGGSVASQVGSVASDGAKSISRAGGSVASQVGSVTSDGAKSISCAGGSVASQVGSVASSGIGAMSSISRAGGSVASQVGSMASGTITGIGTCARRIIPDSLSNKSLASSNGKDDNDDEREWALKRLLWDMDDPSIRTVDDYAPECYGIELPDRLLWQACVMDRDISRPEGSDFYTARPSQPAFQDMNFNAIWKTRKNGVVKKGSFSIQSGGDADAPRVVLWQTCKEDPMDPRGLIMAYEEHGRVLPVVSDFDCFTVGTRGVKYDEPLPEEQVELLQWCVSQVEHVLDKSSSSRSNRPWTSYWLDVLKSSATKGFRPIVPRFGFGDLKSYAIMECAVSRLQESGAVRHGAECFNYYFPQELDKEFLIVSDTLPGNVPWQYVGVSQLQDFLAKKVEEGYTFPLNPKWILCDDERWKEIYDSLMSSEKPNVQDSLDVWFPPESGVRERIESIQERHPRGFVCEKPSEMSGTEAMDLATLELDQYLAFRRAKVKLRAIVAFNELLRSVRQKRKSDQEDDSAL